MFKLFKAYLKYKLICKIQKKIMNMVQVIFNNRVEVGNW